MSVRSVRVVVLAVVVSVALVLAAGACQKGLFRASPTRTARAPSPPTSARESSPPTTSRRPAPDETAVLVAGSISLNASEVALRSRLEGLGHSVAVVQDVDVTTAQANQAELVVMSKTVESTDVGTELKASTTPVIFWEDNQQQLSMLATIDDRDTTGTGWHATGQEVSVDGSVPPSIRAGLSGTVDLLQDADELTYAPKSHAGTPTVAASAVKIAQFGSPGDGRWVVYTIPAGATLADGSRAAGRRTFFGLYDDTFRLMSPDGLALFDALVTLR